MQKTATVMREERKKQMEEERKKIETLKSTDADAYLQGLYERRKEILSRMAEREKKREEMSKRGSKQA